MSELLKINVNEHTEKKGQLTYLSWAWAWAEVLKADPAATWVVHTYGPQGAEQPCMWIGETAMVHTSVTVNGLRRECMLPVMDHKNNALKSPDARKISDAIMRCMTKAISMHGLGLYIYAGEDLPEGEAKTDDHKAGASVIPQSFRSSATMGAIEALDKNEREYVEGLVDRIHDLGRSDRWSEAVDLIEGEKLDDTFKMALWSLLDSKTRAAIKKAQQQQREKVAA